VRPVAKPTSRHLTSCVMMLAELLVVVVKGLENEYLEVMTKYWYLVLADEAGYSEAAAVDRMDAHRMEGFVDRCLVARQPLVYTDMAFLAVLVRIAAASIDFARHNHRSSVLGLIEANFEHTSCSVLVEELEAA